MDRGNSLLPSCHMTSKRSIKTPMNRRFHMENLKGEKYWEQIFQCTQKCEEINSGLK